MLKASDALSPEALLRNWLSAMPVTPDQLRDWTGTLFGAALKPRA